MHTQETIKVVPARYPLRAVGALLALLVLAVVIQSVAFNPRWEWRVFARWFFDPVILEGLGQTLLLTLLATALSVILGGLLALARLSSSWLLSSLAWGYIWLFRSLPLIVVLIILYNFSYLYDTLAIGIPFTAIRWASFETINVLGQFSTAVVGLTLVQSAYVLAMPELFYTIQMIYNRTQEVIPLLMVGAAWYLAITSVLSLIQYLVERGLARSERRSAVNSARSSRRVESIRRPQPQESAHAQLS